jgi:predicted LPLAT superfamily acyltransferase
MIFERPVLLSYGASDGPNRSIVHASQAFTPVKGEPRAEALARARDHFQAFLHRVEAHLRENPYQWLNFLPL